MNPRLQSLRLLRRGAGLHGPYRSSWRKDLLQGRQGGRFLLSPQETPRHVACFSSLRRVYTADPMLVRSSYSWRRRDNAVLQRQGDYASLSSYDWEEDLDYDSDGQVRLQADDDDYRDDSEMMDYEAFSPSGWDSSLDLDDDSDDEPFFVQGLEEGDEEPKDDNLAPSEETDENAPRNEIDYSSKTVVQLKEVLRSRGLPVSGRKAELIERLKSADLNLKADEAVDSLPEKTIDLKADENQVASSPASTVPRPMASSPRPTTDSFFKASAPKPTTDFNSANENIYSEPKPTNDDSADDDLYSFPEDRTRQAWAPVNRGLTERRLLALIDSSEGGVSLTRLQKLFLSEYGTGLYSKTRQWKTLSQFVESFDSLRISGRGTSFAWVERSSSSNDTATFSPELERKNDSSNLNGSMFNSYEVDSGSSSANISMSDSHFSGSGNNSVSLSSSNSHAASGLIPAKLEVSNEAESLLALVPSDLVEPIEGMTEDLAEIGLHKGRRPFAWVNGKRLDLGHDERKVEAHEISAVVDKIARFGADNRAGLDGQLHRISAVRSHEHEIIGLTLRVGRHVAGNANMISDLLDSEKAPSILFLGEPGSGKTTIVREVAKYLAEESNVWIVDTSNEIAGHGHIPHPCIGRANRMMVPSLDKNKQSDVMIECVQNHTPGVMVIDEIGRPAEATAARTCKNRGVRLIASAHGDLKQLIENPQLTGLLGGIETVTIGDETAKREGKMRDGSYQKVKNQRKTEPTFEVIVELKRGYLHTWRVVRDTASSVDRVLQGHDYYAEIRTRNPDTGEIRIDTIMA